MKKLMWAVASALILAGCEKAEVLNDDSCEVQFSISQWDVACEDMMTRSVTASEASMTDVWLMAYSGGTLTKQIHQASTDANFGNFTLNLKAGKYYFYVVTSRGGSPVVDTDAKTITWGSVRDTFWAIDSMEVTNGSANKSITLGRISARVRLSITDVVPDDAQQIIIKPSHWYYGLNYQTGEAVDDSDATISVNIPASYIGDQGIATSFMTISPKDNWTTDVIATMMGTGETTLGSVQVDNVPMARNMSTTLSGSLLSGTRGIGIWLNDTWNEGDEITF